jgi:ATP-binding protein involved in chromosome partitioning
MIDKAAIEAAVSAVAEPELGRSLGQLGMIRSLEVGRKGRVEVQVALPVPGYALAGPIAQDIEAAASSVEGVGSIDVAFVDMDDDDRRRMLGE